MKTHILTSIIIAGALAASSAQAATSVSIDEIYSGMSAAAIQKDQQANPAASRRSTTGKSTCSWHETKDVTNSLYAAHPGSGNTGKFYPYLSPANQNFVC